MPLELSITPHGNLALRDALPEEESSGSGALRHVVVDSGDVYHPLAWMPREAYRVLQDVPIFEDCGLIVRVPDWWKASRPPQPVVTAIRKSCNRSLREKTGPRRSFVKSASVKKLSQSGSPFWRLVCGTFCQTEGVWLEARIPYDPISCERLQAALASR
jgi:hypothetical protein